MPLSTKPLLLSAAQKRQHSLRERVARLYVSQMSSLEGDQFGGGDIGLDELAMLQQLALVA